MSTRAAMKTAARRAMPAATLDWRVRAAAALDARNPHKLDRAREGMRLLLERARPDADLEDLARRYLREYRYQNEVRWHLDLCGPRPVAGLDLLDAVDGAVLVHLVHHGPFLLIGPSMAQSGREIEVLADRGLCAADRNPWQAQSYAVASQACHLFSAEEGLAGVRERLHRGAVVVAATDVPGHTPVRFLGQRLVGSSGAVRAAFEAGTPVVSATAHRADHGASYFRLHPPLHPRDFDSCEALLQALLGRQEEPVLAWPEGYYDPLTKWRRAESPSLV